MGRPSEKRLKISELATLCETTRDALLHYERKGLLRPAFQDENGYRYYELEQYFQVDMIKSFRKMGLSLGEIFAIQQELSPERQLATMKHQKEYYLQEMGRIKNHIENLNYSEEMIKKYSSEPIDEPRIVFRDAEKLVVWEMEERDKNSNMWINETAQMVKYCKEQGITPMQPLGGIIEHEDLINKDFYYKYTTFRTIDETVEKRSVTRPAGKYVTLLHRGLYGKQKEAFEIVMKYISENHLEAVGDGYGEIVMGNLTFMEEAKYLVLYSIQIKE